MTTILLLIFGIAVCAALFLGARWLYIRSVRMKNRLQMSYLFTNITHEILTPLTILSSSIELLKPKHTDCTAEYDMMELNVQRIVRLLQQILETSKSQSGELKLKVSNGDVMEYIHNTALCVKPLMMKKGQQLTIECNPKSMIGWIDPDKLDKIIFNLLSNAAKYSGEKGEISLSVKTNSYFDRISITVQDNGPGMDRQQQKHLFERFYDGNYRKFNVIGNGLGLALTRDLVQLHGGKIQCISSPGKGTAFTVDLPIGKEAFSEDQIDDQHTIKVNVPTSIISDYAKVNEEIRASGNDTPDEEAYKLLVVEDNVQLLLLMKQLLQNQYHVYTARDGVEATEIIKTKPLDLIISDVMMPRMDGNELTHFVKHSPDYAHLPVILLTAKAQEEEREESLLIGADDYITKPFKLSDLRLRINNIIENRQRIQRDFKQQTLEETHHKAAAMTEPDNELLQQALQCVHTHLDDADYDRDAFAADMNMSASTLYNKLRSLTGMSVSSFIRDIRMKEARRIITENPGIRVSDLAYRVGFKDPKYFATIFKKEFGIQPKEFITDAANKQ